MNLERLSNVEKAIVRLTTISEGQTKQMDVLLENSAVIMVVAESVKEHNEQLIDLYNKSNEMMKLVHVQEKELIEKINEARGSITRASYGRFFLAISVMSTINMTFFSINRNYIDKLDSTRTSMISRMGLVEERQSHCYANAKWDKEATSFSLEKKLEKENK